jgi:hypothetical protein
VIGNVNKKDSENTISDEKKMESDYWTKDHFMQEDQERTVIKFGETDFESNPSKDCDSFISS